MALATYTAINPTQKGDWMDVKTYWLEPLSLRAYWISFSLFLKDITLILMHYANDVGSAKGTHVSVYACFLKGDNDDKLSRPFVGNITFTLLNQLEDKNHDNNRNH